MGNYDEKSPFGGVGVEYALSGPWSVKGEYLYIVSPDRQVFDSVPGATTSDQYGVQSNINILRVGLNYRFAPM
jgi:opacity protein-like surface antigen